MTDPTDKTTDRRTATERLREALHKESVACADRGEWIGWDRMAAALTAQGFGHHEDILRAFAEWLNKAGEGEGYQDAVDDYLASLAAKEKAR